LKRYLCILMYIFMCFFFNLKKVHLLVSEIYIYQNIQSNNKKNVHR